MTQRRTAYRDVLYTSLNTDVLYTSLNTDVLKPFRPPQWTSGWMSERWHATATCVPRSVHNSSILHNCEYLNVSFAFDFPWFEGMATSASCTDSPARPASTGSSIFNVKRLST